MQLHGASLLNTNMIWPNLTQTPQEELNRIVVYFGTLYEDSSYSPSKPPALVTLPFTEAQLCDQLRRLPITGALAPDGIPAILWKHFALELVLHDVCEFWCRDMNCPPEY